MIKFFKKIHVWNRQYGVKIVNGYKRTFLKSFKETEDLNFSKLRCSTYHLSILAQNPLSVNYVMR